MARREREIVAMAGAAKVLIALCLFTAVFFLLDWILGFPAVARALLLLGGLGAAGWIARTELVVPLRRRRDEITTALKIEKKFPELRDRLISVVQLADGAGGVSPELLARLESETAGMTAPLNFSEIIDWRFFRRLLLACGALVAAGILCGVVFPQYVSATFRRMFFGDVRYPSLTRIALDEPPTRIIRGANWDVSVTLAGKIPSSVILKMRDLAVEGGRAAGSRWSVVPLKPRLGYTYGVMLEKVQQSFEFQIFAGDAWTDARAVRVLVPVAVFDPLVDLRPPAYSGLKPVTNVPLTGLRVLDGSVVTVKIPTTKAVVDGRLHVEGGAAFPLHPMTNAPGAWATFTLTGSPATAPDILAASNGAASFTIRVKDADDLENQEPLALYTLRVQPDQPPTVRVLSPKSDRLSVPYAEWKLSFEATDDFGLRQAWLAWDVFPAEAPPAGDSGSGSAPAGARKPLRSGRTELHVEADATRWSSVALLDMVAARTVPGETLTAWIEAADATASRATNALPDPAAVGRSAPLTFRIVDENEKWREVQQRLEAVEEGVIHVQDRQEGVRKGVEGLRK
jgi:hypothetical protein